MGRNPPAVALRETHWLTAIREGDRTGFARLERPQRERVVAVVRRALRDADEAEDVTQEIFLTVYHSVREFDGRSRLSTWLYRVALNRALNRLRDLSRRRSTDDHADPTPPAGADES